jgi:hypothetical protein
MFAELDGCGLVVATGWIAAGWRWPGCSAASYVAGKGERADRAFPSAVGLYTDPMDEAVHAGGTSQHCVQPYGQV